MRLVEMLLRRIRPQQERTEKGQAIADLEQQVTAEVERSDKLIAARLASYQHVRLRR